MSNILTEKYSTSFLNIYDPKQNKGQVIRNIIKIEKEVHKGLLSWNKDQIIMFLKEFKSISPVSLQKELTILREFSDFICKEENYKKRKYTLAKSMYILLIDTHRLLSVTLSYEQFQSIRMQLGFAASGETVNYRDKLIFELAWFGLTEVEIRMLKKDDIYFSKSKDGMNIVILSLINDKNTIIDSIEVLEDIKMCIVTNKITRISKDGRFKTTWYKSSEYLIRPGLAGTKSSNDFFRKPTTALKGAFIKQKITCQEIDMNALSLDDIRRSRLILLLSPQNEKLFDFKTVLKLYNLKRVENIMWYRDVSLLKYCGKE